MSVRSKALWAGWVGTALSVASYLAIGSISSGSFPLWIALMTMGTVLCVYGALRRSRWFWLPAIATAVITGGLIWAVSRPEL